jgi:hypothetical protein
MSRSKDVAILAVWLMGSGVVESIRKKLSAIRGISLKINCEVKKSRANVPSKVELTPEKRILVAQSFGSKLAKVWV